jgi:hypothetical protein
VLFRSEGITPEMMAQQRAKAKLLETFLQVRDEDTLRALVKQHESELDYQFFQILTASAQSAQSDGRSDLARALLGLRSFLADMSDTVRASVAEINAAMGLGETITREELLKRLQEAKSDEEWEDLVAAGRPLLDYAFFQNLTAQIESAPDAESASHLRALRSRILDTTAKQDEEARVAMQEAAELLNTILRSEDPEALMRKNVEKLDDLFFAVLSANAQQAQADKRSDWTERLRSIGDIAMRILEEQLPPEVRLVQRLLRSPYPEGTLQILSENRLAITPQLLEAVGHLIEDLQSNRQPKAAEHLGRVLEQAKSIGQGVLQP